MILLDSSLDNMIEGEKWSCLKMKSHRFLFLSVVLTSLHASAAQCPDHWLPGQGIRGLSDGVDAMITWDPDGDGPQKELLVTGGVFTVAGDMIAGRVAAWDGDSWQAFGNGTNGIYAGSR